MCDYSLAHLNSRLAETGEVLTGRKINTGSIGLFSPTDTQGVTPVCVPPGARLAVSNIPPSTAESKKLNESSTGIFHQEYLDEARTHHDGICFVNKQGNSVYVSLQDLAGVSVTVLSLSGASDRAVHQEFAHHSPVLSAR